MPSEEIYLCIVSGCNLTPFFAFFVTAGFEKCHVATCHRETVVDISCSENKLSCFLWWWFFFRPSVTVSRIGLTESCRCRPCRSPTSWPPPPKLSAMKQCSLMELCLCRHCCGGPPYRADPLPHRTDLPAWWQPDGWLGRSAFALTKRTCHSWTFLTRLFCLTARNLMKLSKRIKSRNSWSHFMLCQLSGKKHTRISSLKNFKNFSFLGRASACSAGQTGCVGNLVDEILQFYLVWKSSLIVRKWVSTG